MPYFSISKFKHHFFCFFFLILLYIFLNFCRSGTYLDKKLPVHEKGWRRGSPDHGSLAIFWNGPLKKNWWPLHYTYDVIVVILTLLKFSLSSESSCCRAFQKQFITFQHKLHIYVNGKDHTSGIHSPYFASQFSTTWSMPLRHEIIPARKQFWSLSCRSFP